MLEITYQNGRDLCSLPSDSALNIENFCSFISASHIDIPGQETEGADV